MKGGCDFELQPLFDLFFKERSDNLSLVVILSFVNNIFRIYSLLLVAYALMSWLPGARDSQLGRLIQKLVRPYLDIFDRFIPSIGGISFNVIIALFVLNFIQRGLIYIIINLLA